MADITKINGYNIKDLVARAGVNNADKALSILNGVINQETVNITNKDWYGGIDDEKTLLYFYTLNKIYGKTLMADNGYLQFSVPCCFSSKDQYILGDNVFEYGKEENGGISPLMLSVGNYRNYLDCETGDLHVFVKRANISNNVTYVNKEFTTGDYSSSVNCWKVDFYKCGFGYLIDKYTIKQDIVDFCSGVCDENHTGKIYYSDTDECLYIIDNEYITADKINEFKAKLRGLVFIYVNQEEEEIYNIKHLIPQNNVLKSYKYFEILLSSKWYSRYTDMSYDNNGYFEVTIFRLNI